jgi:hypothetical protein
MTIGLEKMGQEKIFQKVNPKQGLMQHFNKGYVFIGEDWFPFH